MRTLCEKICRLHNIKIESKLDEEYYKEFEQKVYWRFICVDRNFTEQFVRRFANKINWYQASVSMKLSEPFMKEFSDKIYWEYIQIYQNLSESFIEEFIHNMDLNEISKYQKLSNSFIEKYNLKISPKNWLYKTKAYKKNYIRTTTDFIIDDGIIGYADSISIIESHCDCNSDCEESFGLYAYTSGKYKVKIDLNDLGVVLDRNTLRCFKFSAYQ
jgi:hypothetical protein